MKIEIEKPIVPQFVADWVEREKRSSTFHKSFARAINLITHDDDWIKWEYEIGNPWSRIVATAWLHGYEVEQEPLYYAKIKGWALSSSKSSFWNYRSVVEVPTLPILYIGDKEGGEFFKTKMTKEEWNNLGINETNADFEEVE